MKRSLSIVSILALLLLAFQNCKGQQVASESKDDVVLGSAEGYSEVSLLYTHTTLMDYQRMGHPLLTLNRTNGELKIENTSVQTCTLEAARLEKVNQIFSGSQICEPAPLPPDTAHCLAIGMPDIELRNGGETILLAGEICNTGTFLCDGKDKLLREFLRELAANPPVDCAN